MNYEVVLQPALFIVAAVAVLATLAKGVTRTKIPTDEDGVTKTTWGFQAKYGKRASIVFLAAALIIPTLVITPPGHRGVIYSQAGGVLEGERAEGLSFVIPYFQTAHMVNVRTQKFFTEEAFAQSRDLQEITVNVSVNYHIDPRRAAELYRDVGADYEKKVVKPAVFQLVTEEVGLIFAEDFARQREALATAIQEELFSQLGSYGIVVEFVNVEDAIFDPDFIRAVKEKVIADEEAAEQQRLIAAEEAKKQQAIRRAEAEEQRLLIEARGQAEANRVVAESLTVDLLVWQRLREWDGKLPETVLGDTDALNFLVDIPTQTP